MFFTPTLLWIFIVNIFCVGFPQNNGCEPRPQIVDLLPRFAPLGLENQSNVRIQVQRCEGDCQNADCEPTGRGVEIEKYQVEEWSVNHYDKEINKNSRFIGAYNVHVETHKHCYCRCRQPEKKKYCESRSDRQWYQSICECVCKNPQSCDNNAVFDTESCSCKHEEFRDLTSCRGTKLFQRNLTGDCQDYAHCETFLEPIELMPELREYYVPDFRNFRYEPAFVNVHRCSGCCVNEGDICKPRVVRKYNILLQRFSFEDSKWVNNGTHQVTIDEHDRCGCTCNITECNENQIFNPSKCACECTNPDHEKECRVEGWKEYHDWDERICECVCPGRYTETCTDNGTFSKWSCTCEWSEPKCLYGFLVGPNETKVRRGSLEIGPVYLDDLGYVID